MKKLISVVLAVMMICSVLTVIASAQNFTHDDSFILGDVDGNGSVNAKDVLSAKAHIADVTINGLAFYPDPADITADGSVQAKDVYYIKAHLVGVLDLETFDSSESVASFLIGGIDVSEFCIVVPAGTTKNDNIGFASSELQDYIEEATGIVIDVCKGASNATKDHAIVFNKVEYESELGRELGYEGYKMTFSDGNLNIYGTLRGNMYCVYDILAKYLKFNFYSNDTTFIKKSRCVSIPADIDETVVPALRFRFVRQSFGTSGFESRYLPMKINGTQLYSHEEDYKYGLLTGPLFINAHSFGYYWKMSTGYQSQYLDGKSPEYLIEELRGRAYDFGVDMEDGRSDWGSLDPWQPCASSEEDYNTEFEGLVMTMHMIQTWGHAFLETTSIMSFSPCDNIGGLCTCRICSKKAQGGTASANSSIRPWLTANYTGDMTVDGSRVTFKEEHHSGVYVDFMNRAAYDITHEEKKYYTGVHTDPETSEKYTLDLGDLETTYENIDLMGITYDLYVPESVRPAENLIIVFCGQGCNQHYMGTEDCGDNKTVVVNQHYTREYTNVGPNGTNYAIKTWAELCHETGAELWFWYYPVSYIATMAPTPCVTNIYKDIKWMVTEAHVDGIYYEGGGETYAFENLKAHIAANVLWDPDMTDEEYVEMVKEYLYIYYGPGYEKVYSYLEMHQECGDESGSCYINNCSLPDKMYSFDYLREHYVEMRQLLKDAKDMTNDSTQKKRIDTLTATLDTVGLQAVRRDWYGNGTNVAGYKALYDEFVGLVQKYNLDFGKGSTVEAGDYETDIFEQVNY